ncbi:hypothetical protein PUN4_230020 [Paraburkholderia unamae]|nr:hypothetical protein PUN4_230020 [Paraburkholderia unamae]
MNMKQEVFLFNHEMYAKDNLRMAVTQNCMTVRICTLPGAYWCPVVKGSNGGPRHGGS